MEVTVHLPVSLISDLISRALRGHTRLELCKFYQYADLNSGCTAPYRKITISVRGCGRCRLRAGGAAPGWNHREHIMAGVFATLYVAYTMHSVRHCSHRASLAFLLSKRSYSIFTSGGPWATLLHTPRLVYRLISIRAHNGMPLRNQPTHPMVPEFGWDISPTCLLVAESEYRSFSGIDSYHCRRVITDRFANENPSIPCNHADQTYCGGTWNSIMNHLDYVQSMGFTAIWISPVNKNYDGPRTPYGDPYHGYWVTDISKLNDKFGTADDLKALSKALHDRNMLLMVDIVLNHGAPSAIQVLYSH